MKGVAILVVVALLVGWGIFWKGVSRDEVLLEVEGSERVAKSKRERQLEGLRAKSSRVLSAESAQGKIEGFLSSNEMMGDWDQKTVVGFNELAYYWGVTDPRGAMEEAVAFVESLPSGREREVVAGSFAIAVARMNPEVAIEWAETITDQAKQDETMIRTLLHWAIVDREAAKSWVETAEMTPEVREVISKSSRFGNGEGE
ncbi:MAG: hypothetical protein ACI8UZ_001394 [Akkermansiaceae bacterium]|jgi:hypothetical protein